MDPKQIPPVNHLDARPLMPQHQSFYKIGLVSLETIMRQSMDNPILAYATRIRKAEGNIGDFPVDTHLREDGTGIIKLASTDGDGITAILKQKFDCEEFHQDADHMKIICWRNDTVNTFNHIVRELIYKDTLPEGEVLPSLMIGEKLIVDEPVILPNNKILLTTNEEIEILRHEVKKTTIQYTSAELVNREWTQTLKEEELTYYNTWVRYFDEDGDEAECNIRILHENDKPKMASALKSIADKANAIAYGNPLRNKLWKGYFTTKRLFAAVKYNYAITGHKSQGSTFENCMVIDWDLSVNRNIAERNRIRYVAVTRARSLLYIVK